MQIYNFSVEKQTKGFTSILDITDDVQQHLKKTNIHNGLTTVFVPGSTGAITTVEYEPGLLQDIPEFLEKIIPQHQTYHHDKTWGDGNGYAHLRAALLGPSLSIPVQNGALMLGTWQQIILIDFDNRPRKRKIVVQVFGE